MGFDDKFDNKTDEFSGKAKETIGDVTGDDELKAEGSADEVKGKTKQVGEQIKDLGKDVKDKFSK
ncbi:MAG: CsbD family protein [Brevibacterium sp.]|uniref:CsbD family protein n=1 Tax=Brevibacterium sp. TaxID=1701 RepID=UPI002648E84D|nr:CsbD family protein [Brevibacterium sp.]MDN5805773.1 CsbD family protein [Brevibacterium sp.]MDN5833725.1 CsbD family protein [Brevibacterium sp.]MDN5876632.1 CsbD family protein [Brevibacterium sp.]MDN6123376.1 CsbD family protein [Brevibacterium sp.]MDN6133604.1 CsbD family protein [Brevibacterium sp.]